MIPSAPRAILVGAGRMGAHHLRAIRRGSGLELVGIVERDPSRHPLLAEEFLVPCHSTLDALLDRAQADCALVCTPDLLHAPDALRCLRAGLHVLVEKPLCPSLLEARHLVDAFRQGGRILAGGLVERHNPAWSVFLRNVPDLGELEDLEILRSGRTPLQTASGILRDLAIHDLDLLWGWLGPSPLRPVLGSDVAEAFLRGSSKPRISLVARWNDAPPCRKWRLQGEGGTLLLDLQARTVARIRPGGDIIPLGVPALDPLEQEHRLFAATIRGEADPLQLDLARQLEVLAFCETLAPESEPGTT